MNRQSSHPVSVQKMKFGMAARAERRQHRGRDARDQDRAGEADDERAPPVRVLGELALDVVLDPHVAVIRLRHRIPPSIASGRDPSARRVRPPFLWKQDRNRSLRGVGFDHNSSAPLADVPLLARRGSRARVT